MRKHFVRFVSGPEDLPQDVLEDLGISVDPVETNESGEDSYGDE